jgi:hypothetical protein
VSGDDWPCEAYGPDGLAVGARCFVAGELGRRVCGSAADCAEVMGAERRRVFRRLQELAAAGDPVAVELAEAFGTPDGLLGGDDADPPPP